MLFEIASEMRRGDEFPKATLCANASLLVLYLAAMAVGYAYEGDHVAGFLPDSVPDGPAKTVIGFLLYFHVMITYAAALAFSRALRVFSARSSSYCQTTAPFQSRGLSFHFE